MSKWKNHLPQNWLVWKMWSLQERANQSCQKWKQFNKHVKNVLSYLSQLTKNLQGPTLQFFCYDFAIASIKESSFRIWSPQTKRLIPSMDGFHIRLLLIKITPEPNQSGHILFNKSRVYVLWLRCSVWSLSVSLTLMLEMRLTWLDSLIFRWNQSFLISFIHIPHH